MSSEQSSYYLETGQRYFEIYICYLSDEEGQQLICLIYSELTN